MVFLYVPLHLWKCDSESVTAKKVNRNPHYKHVAVYLSMPMMGCPLLLTKGLTHCKWRTPAGCGTAPWSQNNVWAFYDNRQPTHWFQSREVSYGELCSSMYGAEPFWYGSKTSFSPSSSKKQKPKNDWSTQSVQLTSKMKGERKRLMSRAVVNVPQKNCLTQPWAVLIIFT